MTGAERYRAALAVLGRSAASLAPLLGCHPRTCEGWLSKGPPAAVLTWLEAGAAGWLSLPVPNVVLAVGRPRRPGRGD